jgi:hypothetical protein
VLTVEGRNMYCEPVPTPTTLGLTITRGSYDADERGDVIVADHWGVEDTKPYRFSAIGNVDVTRGDVRLALWKSVTRTGAELTDNLDATNRLTGTLRDPRPGNQPIFALDACTRAVTGHRRP